MPMTAVVAVTVQSPTGPPPLPVTSTWYSVAPPTSGQLNVTSVPLLVTSTGDGAVSGAPGTGGGVGLPLRSVHSGWSHSPVGASVKRACARRTAATVFGPKSPSGTSTGARPITLAQALSIFCSVTTSVPVSPCVTGNVSGCAPKKSSATSDSSSDSPSALLVNWVASACGYPQVCGPQMCVPEP